MQVKHQKNNICICGHELQVHGQVMTFEGNNGSRIERLANWYPRDPDWCQPCRFPKCRNCRNYKLDNLKYLEKLYEEKTDKSQKRKRTR